MAPDRSGSPAAMVLLLPSGGSVTCSRPGVVGGGRGAGCADMVMHRRQPPALMPDNGVSRWSQDNLVRSQIVQQRFSGRPRVFAAPVPSTL